MTKLIVGWHALSLRRACHPTAGVPPNSGDFRQENAFVDRALWLLLGLQLGGWLRFLGRSLGTVKGIAFALLGAVIFAPWLLTIVLSPPSEGRADPETVRRYGPVLLLGLTVMSGTLALTVQ